MFAVSRKMKIRSSSRRQYKINKIRSKQAKPPRVFGSKGVETHQFIITVVIKKLFGNKVLLDKLNPTC